MISRTLESWRSLPRLTLREAAAIAGISKRKLEQRLPQLDVTYDGATRFVSTESLRRYLGEGGEETRRVVVQSVEVRRKVEKLIRGMR